jgi:hypothetical protein
MDTVLRLAILPPSNIILDLLPSSSVRMVLLLDLLSITITVLRRGLLRTITVLLSNITDLPADLLPRQTTVVFPEALPKPPKDILLLIILLRLI